ncbi:DNA binding protein, partial [Phytophthora megakarya]
TPFAIFKQPPSRKLETEIYNRINQNGFGRGVWGEVAPLMDKHDVQIYCNSKGWWNANLSIKFLRFHFGSRASLGEKILLLWDDFSGHWTQPVRDYAASINVVLMKIPPGYTSSCQPADIAWMKPFKLELRSLWVEHLQLQLRAHQQSDIQSKFKLQAPSRGELMLWLSNAWNKLPTATLESGFRKLAIPTNKREPPVTSAEDREAEINELVDKLEALQVAAEV